MIIQNRDGSLLKEPFQRQQKPMDAHYRVEIPAQLLDEQSGLIDRIIAFAFDTLGAQRVDVRVRESE